MFSEGCNIHTYFFVNPQRCQAFKRKACRESWRKQGLWIVTACLQVKYFSCSYPSINPVFSFYGCFVINVNIELCFFYFQISTLGAEFSSEACRELGFSSNLLCSSCDLLGQFNLLQLDPDCRGCCQEEAQFETKKVLFSACLAWDDLAEVI